MVISKSTYVLQHVVDELCGPYVTDVCETGMIEQTVGRGVRCVRCDVEYACADLSKLGPTRPAIQDAARASTFL